MTELADRLSSAASLGSDDGAIRCRATYEPGAGAGAKVSPPTYPAAAERRPGQKPKPSYLIEQRSRGDGEKSHETVILDTRQSQANRCEEALSWALEAGTLRIPVLVLEATVGGQELRITSLTAPHRSRDSYFRDSEDLTGKPFDATTVGLALASARPSDATPYYRHTPADLVFGVWDSHRDLRLMTRFPRVYTSEIVGWDFVAGEHAAGRTDPYTSGAEKVYGGNLDWQQTDTGKNGKKNKLSKLGLGSIPPSRMAVGGVTVNNIERLGTLSFAGLARIQVGSNAAQRRAGRAVLAALALLGDRLAFEAPALFLRSGCDLVLLDETLEWVQRGGRTEPLILSRSAALDLVTDLLEQAKATGLTWEDEAVRLRPQAQLQAALDYAFRTAADVDEDEALAAEGGE